MKQIFIPAFITILFLNANAQNKSVNVHVSDAKLSERFDDYIKNELQKAAEKEQVELSLYFSRDGEFNEHDFGEFGKFTKILQQWTDKEEIEMEEINEYQVKGDYEKLKGWKFSWK